MRDFRVEMKRRARSSMRTQRPSVYAVALLLMVLLWVLEILSIKLLFPGENLLEIAQHYVSSVEAQTVLPEAELSASEFAEQYLAMQEAIEPPTGFGRLLDVAIRIMTLMLSTGFTFFCLNVARGAAAGPGNLLDSFGIFFRVLWLSILTSIFTFLWSLLLFIPGIVAAYRYSFAIYVLLDDPGKSAMECIRESSALTNGHKWELFVLDLSFLGWLILSAIPFVGIFTMPYMEITRANYYCAISGRTAVPGELPYDDDPAGDEP